MEPEYWAELLARIAHFYLALRQPCKAKDDKCNNIIKHTNADKLTAATARRSLKIGGGVHKLTAAEARRVSAQGSAWKTSLDSFA